MRQVMRGAAIAVVLCAGGWQAQAQTQTLKTVQARGSLVCGVNQSLAGFSAPDEKGVWQGIDADYCRAMAAAIFGDASKAKFVPLSAKDRFTALQSGEVDVLPRNSTFTLSRDTQLGLDFPAVNYYDGQGFMVRKAQGVKSAKELGGASICAQTGTTTELNAADYFRANNLKYELVVFVNIDDVIKAYESGRCDAFTTDMSQVYGERLKLTAPDDHLVLPDVISKEPLSVAVRHGDNQWGDIVRWVHSALVNAEEYGLTQANIEEKVKSEQRPDVKRLLGTEGSFGEMLGLSKDWAVNAIKAVGNYGEVFERNVGQGSRLKIKRGLNDLWTRGGLQYGYPVR